MYSHVALCMNIIFKNFICNGAVVKTVILVAIICLACNPFSQYPERVFHASSTVTSVDFSHLHPNLLAVSAPLQHW